MLSQFIQKLKDYGLEYFKKYYSNYQGIVEDNDDPKNLGRIQIKVPQIYGETPYKYWAKPKGMYAGNAVGMFVIPNIGDGVWVEFENGNARYPIWSHGWWAKNNVPDGATILNKVFQTTSGNKIEFDDENGLIRITDKNKNIVEMNETGISHVSEKVSLGSLDGSAEPVALGDTLKGKLEDIIGHVSDIAQNIASITVPTALGPSGPPINAPAFIATKAQLTALNATLQEILSNKTTTD
jgi:hypothetical protein